MITGNDSCADFMRQLCSSLHQLPLLLFPATHTAAIAVGTSALQPLTPRTRAMQRLTCNPLGAGRHGLSTSRFLAYQYFTDLQCEHCVVVGFWHTLHVLTSIDIRLATAALSHQGSPSRLLLLCSGKSGKLSAVCLRTITTLQMHSTQRQKKNKSTASTCKD
jgi:hypothetical protein